MSSTKNSGVRSRVRRHLTLTERDGRVVRLVGLLGMATVEQVKLLEFGEGNRSRAQTRLGVLRQVGLLDVLPGRLPNEPAIYVLSAKGRDLLAPIGGAADLRMRRVHYGRLRHDLAITDVRVRIMRTTTLRPGLRLVRWLDEEALRPITLPHGLLPDAWFQVERDAVGHSPRSAYFLEVEVSEKSERALKSKLIAMGAYLIGGKYAATFGTRSCRVLILIRPGPGGSAERLVRRTTELAHVAGVPYLRVAELNVFLGLRPDELFTAPIWSQPGVDKPVALFAGGDSDDQPEQHA